MCVFSSDSCVAATLTESLGLFGAHLKQKSVSYLRLGTSDLECLCPAVFSSSQFPRLRFLVFPVVFFIFQISLTLLIWRF